MSGRSEERSKRRSSDNRRNNALRRRNYGSKQYSSTRFVKDEPRRRQQKKRPPSPPIPEQYEPLVFTQHVNKLSGRDSEWDANKLHRGNVVVTQQEMRDYLSKKDMIPDDEDEIDEKLRLDTY